MSLPLDGSGAWMNVDAQAEREATPGERSVASERSERDESSKASEHEDQGQRQAISRDRREERGASRGKITHLKLAEAASVWPRACTEEPPEHFGSGMPCTHVCLCAACAVHPRRPTHRPTSMQCCIARCGTVMDLPSQSSSKRVRGSAQVSWRCVDANVSWRAGTDMGVWGYQCAAPRPLADC